MPPDTHNSHPTDTPAERALRTGELVFAWSVWPLAVGFGLAIGCLTLPAGTFFVGAWAGAAWAALPLIVVVCAVAGVLVASLLALLTALLTLIAGNLQSSRSPRHE